MQMAVPRTQCSLSVPWHRPGLFGSHHDDFKFGFHHRGPAIPATSDDDRSSTAGNVPESEVLFKVPGRRCQVSADVAAASATKPENSEKVAKP